MPKEYINSVDFDRKYPLVDPNGKPSGELSEADYTSTRVTWGRESMHVGLSVVDFVNDPDGFESTTVNLDRHGINRLIRALRKARDQAFGADA